VGSFKFLKGETKREKMYNGVFVQELKPEYKIVEEYWVQEPFAKVYIVTSPELGVGHHYFVEEVKLNGDEGEAHRRLVAILSKELQAPESLEVDASSYVLNEAKRIALKYRRSLKKFNEESLEKIFYYVVRDLAGYGDLNTPLMDPNIEDISCNGLHKPIYIWHRKYESIPTNLSFTDELIYDNFILKLAHLSGKHISSAHPMLDAMLPEKHRLACTFMREVSTLGSTFCVRKFRPDPFSVIDLITLGTMDAKLAAYLWLLLENKMNLMIIGGTGAGKTSMLNALTSLLSPNDKIITVEEVAELNPPHENWVQLVSRKGFRFGSSDTTSISLFDLVKLSLRYRPDYIVVGEIRGEEAYVLFQAVATGHGGLCTMHADSLDHAIKRLTSPPMNVAEVYVPLMNVGIYVARVDLPKKVGGVAFGRRVRDVWEIVDYGKYHHLSNWMPSQDLLKSDFNNSFLLDKIAEKRGLSKEILLQEINNREVILNEMAKQNIRDQREVAQAIMKYYEEKQITMPKKSAADSQEEKEKEEIQEDSQGDEDFEAQVDEETLEEIPRVLKKKKEKAQE